MVARSSILESSRMSNGFCLDTTASTEEGDTFSTVQFEARNRSMKIPSPPCVTRIACNSNCKEVLDWSDGCWFDSPSTHLVFAHSSDIPQNNKYFFWHLSRCSCTMNCCAAYSPQLLLKWIHFSAPLKWGAFLGWKMSSFKAPYFQLRRSENSLVCEWFNDTNVTRRRTVIERSEKGTPPFSHQLYRVRNF